MGAQQIRETMTTDTTLRNTDTAWRRRTPHLEIRTQHGEDGHHTKKYRHSMVKMDTILRNTDTLQTLHLENKEERYNYYF